MKVTSLGMFSDQQWKSYEVTEVIMSPPASRKRNGKGDTVKVLPIYRTTCGEVLQFNGEDSTFNMRDGTVLSPSSIK